MKLTQRDKAILLLLPALVICCIYGHFFFRPKFNEWKTAGNALAAAAAKAPEDETKVRLTQIKLAGANRKVQTLESDLKHARQSWDAAAAHCTDPRLRNERIARLNGLLARRNLRVIEDAAAEGGKDGKLATGVESLCEELASMSAQQKPQLRKVRIVGRYLDLVAALDDLANREMVAIPVGLMMKEAHPSYAVREWVLLVWI